MRLAVLDIGSNSAHLLVVDAHPGAAPLPATSHKGMLRLAELLDEDGAIRAEGREHLLSFVREALRVAEDQGAEEILAFATSALREAGNGPELLDAVAEELGVRLRVLSGQDEARITFLAARRWFGWSAGHLLLLDIGGGSLELASGQDEYPDTALSVPLGAGRMHQRFLAGAELADPESVRELARHARTVIGREAARINRVGSPDQVVASSKTFRSLARLTGAAPSGEGRYVPRSLAAADLPELIDRLAGMTPAQRAELPGVSTSRAPQVLAGAIVAQAACTIFGLDTLAISPWALREGLIMRRLDSLDDPDRDPQALFDAR